MQLPSISVKVHYAAHWQKLCKNLGTVCPFAWWWVHKVYYWKELVIAEQQTNVQNPNCNRELLWWYDLL